MLFCVVLFFHHWVISLLRPFCSLSGSFCPWDFSGKNTEVGCHFILQGIFLTQGSDLRLLNWQVNSLPLSLLGSPSDALLMARMRISLLPQCLDPQDTIAPSYPGRDPVDNCKPPALFFLIITGCLLNGDEDSALVALAPPKGCSRQAHFCQSHHTEPWVRV